ncbi:MAG: metallophosphoesterase [Bdellovibrionota bacterium]
MPKFFYAMLLAQVICAFYLYRRFLRPLKRGGWRKKIGFVVLILAFVFLMVTPLTLRVLKLPVREPLTQLYYWIANPTIAILVTVIFYSLFVDGTAILVRFMRRLAKSKPYDKERQRFFRQAGQAGVLLAASASTGLGLRQALAGPIVKEVRVPITGLADGLVGLRIAQLSDLHVGPMINRAYVERVVEMTNSLKADLIALTGDFVDGSVAQLRNDVEELAKLRAPYGIFFCSGNHEFYSGIQEWMQYFKTLGFRVLENQHTVQTINGARLLIAGVHDYTANQRNPDYMSDPDAALVGASPADLKILLAHQPRSCFAASKAGFDLQLSGHTHAGQFFPFSLVVRFAHPYVRGLNLHDKKMWVYVNQATGYWGPPSRLGVPAEVTLLVLERA